MHCCFQVLEIQRMICDELKYENSYDIRDGASTRALAALACTCTSWSTVALDALWSRIFGIPPLIKCMPQDLWEVQFGTLILRRPLKSSDLKTLEKYTPRVRYLLAETFAYNCDISYEVSQALVMAFNRRPLLPNLQELFWESESDVLRPLLPMFLTNGLRTLSLGASSLSVGQCTLFATTLSSLAPEITHLAVYTPKSPPHTLDSIGLTEAIYQWHGISTLDIRELNISAHDLLRIASMPNLTSLKMGCLEVSSKSNNTEISSSLDAIANLQPPFPMLRSLSLDNFGPGRTLRDIIKVIRLLRGASITTLNIEGREDSGGDCTSCLAELFQALEQHCNHTTLREVGLLLICSVDIKTGILFSTFSPLLQFTALEVVRLHVSPGIMINEEEASQIAASWSCLRALELFRTGIKSLPEGPMTTLSSLVPIARRCLNLETLHIILDASDPETHKSLVENPEKFKGIRNYSLRELAVGRSLILEKEFVAMFLSEIFPNVKISSDHTSRRFYYGPSDQAEFKCGRRWSYVNQVLLPLIRGARQYENAYLGSVVGHGRNKLVKRLHLEEEEESYLAPGWHSD